MLDTFIRFKIDEKGTLVPFSKLDNTKLKLFLNAIKKDTPIETYMTIVEGDEKTNGQLAKIHAMIKELSDYTRQPYKWVKEYIKEKAGLVRPISAYPYTIASKSFGDCTKEELGQAIEACQELLDEINSRS